MELKQVSPDSKNFQNIKFNVNKKLKKAVEWANKFSQICDSLAVKKTSLEAAAQKAFLEGLLFIEKQNFAEALEQLMISKKIMLDLKEIADAISKAHLQERLDQSEHYIRFCKYHLRQFDSSMQNELFKQQK